MFSEHRLFMETLDAVERERDEFKTKHTTTLEKVAKVLQEKVAKLRDLQAGEIHLLFTRSAHTYVN